MSLKMLLHSGDGAMIILSLKLWVCPERLSPRVASGPTEVPFLQRLGFLV
jgi:hypothetical protein